jgi:phosphinothricin acetyltransferase
VPTLSAAIRFATLNDAEQIAEIYAPIVRDSIISFEEEPPDASEIRARMAALQGRYPWLVAVDADDRVLGYAYASEHRVRPGYRWSVDTTIYLAQRARGRGLGKVLYSDLLRIVEEQGFYTAYAGITLPNDASVGVHASVGFTLLTVFPAVGFKHGRWHDVSWWRRPLKEPTGVPHEPLPLDAISFA